MDSWSSQSDMTEKKNQTPAAAVVLAAGRGKRMGSGVAKQYLMLNGKPLVYYSLAAFERSSLDAVVLVTGGEEIEYCRREIVEKYQFHKVKEIVAGGEERYHSVYRGLRALEKFFARLRSATRDNFTPPAGFSSGEFPELGGRTISEARSALENGFGAESCGEDGIVLIHDGARPLVTQEIISRVTDEAKRYRACAAAMPVKDTIKIVDRDGFSAGTPERSSLWQMQTPQAFSYQLIYSAYKKLFTREEYQMGVTDDAMVIENLTDTRVKLIQGDYSNIKVTTPEDMVTVSALLSQKSGCF